MHEFNGWFRLHDSPYEDEFAELDAAVADLRARIESLHWSSAQARIVRVNGEYCLVVTGLINRVRQEKRELDALIDFVGTRFPGAYGVLYERSGDPDPELPDGAFSVGVMARGRFSRHADPFLSPVNPTIED